MDDSLPPAEVSTMPLSPYSHLNAGTVFNLKLPLSVEKSTGSRSWSVSWMWAGDTPGWTAALTVAGGSICTALQCVDFEFFSLCLLTPQENNTYFP